jgi:hypothetical protein
MRNLFDQYNQPENRLSHALAVCLNEDRTLLRGFLIWIGVKAPVAAASLSIVEQSLPGDPPDVENDAERRGLPDIVIHDDESWCLLIESKIQASLTEDQLQRHERTLRRRGFEKIRSLALTKAEVRVSRGVMKVRWSDLYEWLGKDRERREWPERLRSYLRAAEVRLAQDEYLTEGTLTMFDGFPFSGDNPYTYGEGKRLLKLALHELRKDPVLRALGMDPNAPGRGAITGRGGRGVWDFLSLKKRRRSGSFTAYPHLTLSVHAERLEVALTIPNGVARPIRQRLIDLGPDGLTEINAQILRRTRRLIERGGSIHAHAVQRHYLGQRSPSITDATLSFRLETSQLAGLGGVKRQRRPTQEPEMPSALTRSRRTIARSSARTSASNRIRKSGRRPNIHR